MAGQAATERYDLLLIELADEDGVSVDAGKLYVHGRIFAFLEHDDLAVDLPLERANDLIERGVGERLTKADHPTRDWVRVSDLALWRELAGEAHDFAGEPPVGGQS